MAWLKRGKEKTTEEVFLRNIGANSLNEINTWFKKSYAGEYRIDGIKEAVSLAKRFKEKKVRIVGDYDGDGVNATVILFLAFKWAGFKDVSYRIPKRFTEGFGINEKIIDEIDEGLVITCDNGIAQLSSIQKAKDKGLTVIIIDHHLPVSKDDKVILPPADVIIDPNAIEGSADFNGYCGAGLSYRFACELLNNEKKYCYKLLGYAAIGTVTDVMELREENYVFVRNGLKILKDPRYITSGLYALISAFGLTHHLRASDIGFKIGPAINAASRMKNDGAKNAVELLIFNGSYPEAVSMAEKLVETNNARKELKKTLLKKAHNLIEEECLFGDVPLIIYIPYAKEYGVDTVEGIIGIVAGSLCEEYKVPVIVFSDSLDGCIKGSARACGNYNMKQELDKCADLLLHYGGHEGAAGLSVQEENISLLKDRLMENVSGFKMENVNDTYYDLEIEASDIPDVIDELSNFEPFGQGNADIVFKVNQFSVIPRYGTYKKLIGEDNSIVKIYSNNTTAIGFDMADGMHNIEQPKILDLIGTLSNNYFRGEIEHQLEFIDFKLKETKCIETPLANRLKKMAMFK